MSRTSTSVISRTARKLGAICAVATVFVAMATPKAVAATIDFSSSPTGAFSSLTVGDYKFTGVGYGDLLQLANDGGHFVLVDSDPNNGSGAEATLTRVDGGVFSVTSVAINSLTGYSDYRIDLGSTSYYTVPSFQTDVYPDGATNVTAFDINIVDGGSGFEVSDLNVTSPNPVPEPASLALLGTGVAFVTTQVRRRRKNA